jgi:hypothetical protein
MEKSLVDWAEREVSIGKAILKDALTSNDSNVNKDDLKKVIKSLDLVFELYKSLLNDETYDMVCVKLFFDRLVELKPLTNLKGGDDEWDEISPGKYVNNRKVSVYKIVMDDGKVIYTDKERAVLSIMEVDERKEYYSQLASALADHMFPIEFPYSPEDNEKRYIFITDSFTDGYYHILKMLDTVEGKQIDIDKYFLEGEELIELTKEQYEEAYEEWKKKESMSVKEESQDVTASETSQSE